MPPEINRQNIGFYLKQLADTYRKQNRKSPPVEIIIVGGGSILLNYAFRDMTTDIDMFSTAADSILHAAKSVAEKHGLPMDWINSDFTRTSSFSPKLREVSSHFRTYNNGKFEIRTVSSEYLIAMKLKAYRPYKNDISDVVGIILSEKENANNITLEQIGNAYNKLYGEELPKHFSETLSDYLRQSASELSALYQSLQIDEHQTKNSLIQIDQKYPGKLSEDNLENVIRAIEAGKTVSKSDL